MASIKPLAGGGVNPAADKSVLAVHQEVERVAGEGAQKQEKKLTAMEHVSEWWAEVKAECPPPHHRNSLEFFEEQLPRLAARLEGL